jgi:tetratricopeptide (TPR) repeat protein
VVDGRTELIDGRHPRRVQDKMRQRLGRLSDEASDAVTVAASLGRTFTFDELARTLGRRASDLLAPVRELLDANLLVERDERLAFWHEITREAVRTSVPVTARRALDRQAAGVLLETGALPVEVAVQLAASAEPGDEIAVTTLLDAAKALVTTDQDTAAQFGQRALEIAPAHHPKRGEIVGTTAIALHIAGNSEEAIAFADHALRETLPAPQEAEVRLSIAGMFAISPEIRIGAGRLALKLPDLPETLRARHLACLFHNLVTAGRIDAARAILDKVRAAVASTDDTRASFTLHVAESALEYADDNFGPSLELITAAYRDGIFARDDQRLRLAHMWHGELLSVTDHSEEAFAIAADGLAAAQRDRQGWAYEMFETWNGRMLLRAGRLSEALAVLEGRFALEDGTHAAAVLDAAGIVALGRLAIHTGDTRQVRRFRDIAQVMLERGTPAVRRHAGWLLALFAMAEGDADAARRWLHAPTEPDGRAILPRFPLDIADEVLLARIALATKDDALAQLALHNSRRRAELNPGITSIAATAVHVRGLLERSHADLREAADLFERTPRRVELAAALEDLGAELTRILASALVICALGGGLAPAAARGAAPVRLQLGRSEDGRPIVTVRAGDPQGTRVLVVGCIHGTECAGIAVARVLERVHARVDLWIVPNLNPDGYVRGTRQNGRGVDLKANWSSQWHGGGRPWDTYYPGPRPFSERETRIARNLILRIRPRVTIWFHQHMNLVWAWGASSAAGRVYARAAGMRFYHHHWPAGTAANWQNHYLLDSASFTVELRAGSLTPQQVQAQVRAVLTLATALRGQPHA